MTTVYLQLHTEPVSVDSDDRAWVWMTGETITLTSIVSGERPL